MRNFYTDPNYLLLYERRNILIYMAILAAILAFGGADRIFSTTFLWFLLPIFLISFFHFAVSLVGVLLYVAILGYLGDIPNDPLDGLVAFAGILIGGKSATWMHNAAHRNFRWPWLSTLVGEACSVQQLIGYRQWQIAHFFHHKSPDDPQYDPHPPMYSSFVAYILKMKFGIAMKFDTFYFSRHEKTPENEKIWGLTGLLMLISSLIKIILWYALLGPKYFLLFFVVSNVATNVIYAHFNYFTHRPNPSEKGKFDILDLNSGWYKLLNWYLAGSYYHSTHHKRPNLYNPGKARVAT